MPTKTRTTGHAKRKRQENKPRASAHGAKQGAAGEPQKRTIHGGRGRTGSKSNKTK